MTRRFKKVMEKTTALREKFWPDLSADDLWNRKEYDGFTSIPRTMPLIMNIIDDLTKAKPASSTYFALWCKAFDEMYVSLQNAEELAFHAGFTGQRAVRTWQERMKDLADLGFIKVAAGPRGSMSHAAIPNPHFVIRRLHLAKQPGLTEAAYNTLLERGSEVSALDLSVELPEDKAAREAAEATTLAAVLALPKAP